MIKKSFVCVMPLLFLFLSIMFPTVKFTVLGVGVYAPTFFTLSVKLLATVFLLYRLVRYGDCVITLLLCFSLFSTLIADIAYLQSYFLKPEEKPLQMLTYNLFYFLYISFIVGVVFKTFLKNSKEFFLIVVSAFLFLVLGYYLSQFKLVCLFEDSSVIGTLCCSLHLSVAILFSSILFYSFREENRFYLFFLQPLLLSVIAHYGLSLRQEEAKEAVFFEYAWELSAMSLCSISMFYIDKFKGESKSNSSFLSLRSLIILLSLIGGGIVLSGLIIMDIAIIPDDVTISYTALLLGIVWVFSNVFGFYLSKYITEKTSVEGTKPMESTNIIEIDGIKNQFNELQEKYIEETKYGAFGRAAMCLSGSVKGVLLSTLTLLSRRKREEDIELHKSVATLHSFVKMMGDLCHVPKSHLKHIVVSLSAYISTGKRKN